MNQKKQLSILEFSRLTGISRDNLRFYDRIGLLCPEQRGENNYRYYARHQLNSAYLIGSLRLLEVGLEDIRHYSAGRTPERMLALFARQEERIQAEIARLRETSEIMKLRASLAREALAHADGEVLVEERPRETHVSLSPSAGGDERRGERELRLRIRRREGNPRRLPRRSSGQRPAAAGPTASILKPAAGGATHGSRLGESRRLWTKHSRRFRAGLGRTPARLSGEPEPAPHRQRLRRAAAGRSPSRIRGTISDGWRSRWRLIPVWKEESNFFCGDPP